MKLQLGLLHTDGYPVEPAEVHALLGPYIPPAETSGEWLQGPLLIAFRGDRITEEEDHETQPLRLGPYVITWDGRLDNRAAIASFLGQSETGVSDPLLVLSAYERFGQAVLSDLIGEFALTLWCSRTRSLLLARSSCGARPLYYALTADRLTWCSDFAHLCRVASFDPVVDDDYAVDYLVGLPHPSRTPFRNISAVAPNSILRFAGGRLVTAGKLWDPSRVRSLHYRMDAEYEEHCRQLIREAVAVRLRSRYPVFAELSGGFDSSTVVLMADQILKDRNQPPNSLQTLSCVYEQSTTCDESRYITAVERRRGIPTHRISEAEQHFNLEMDNPSFAGVPSSLQCSGRYEAFAARMRTQDARVLLTGQGGDFLFWSAPDGAPVIADALRKGDLRAAHRECCAWSRAMNVPYGRLMLGKALPLAAGGQWLRRADATRHFAPPWIKSANGRRMDSDILMPAVGAMRTLPSIQARLLNIERVSCALSSGQYDEFRELYVSHPYSHRPLLEFILAIPISQLLRDGQTRSLMRRSLREILPPKLLTRVSKAGFDEVLARGLEKQRIELSDVRRWQLCERGYIEPQQLAEALSRMRLGICEEAGVCFRAVSLERWLRSLSRLREAPPSNINELGATANRRSVPVVG